MNYNENFSWGYEESCTDDELYDLLPDTEEEYTEEELIKQHEINNDQEPIKVKKIDTTEIDISFETYHGVVSYVFNDFNDRYLKYTQLTQNYVFKDELLQKIHLKFLEYKKYRHKGFDYFYRRNGLKQLCDKANIDLLCEVNKEILKPSWELLKKICGKPSTVVSTKSKMNTRYVCKKASDISITTTKGFIIDRLLPENSFGLIVGEEKTGKSTFACLLGIAVSNGSDFIDKNLKTKQNVMFVSFEGDGENMIASFKNKGLDVSNLYSICNSSYTWNTIKNDLYKDIIEKDIKLIILDCMYMLIEAGESDADAKTMQSYINDFKHIADNMHCTVLVVTHTNRLAKEESLRNKTSGSVNLQKSMEFCIFLESQQTDEELQAEAYEKGIDYIDSDNIDVILTKDRYRHMKKSILKYNVSMNRETGHVKSEPRDPSLDILTKEERVSKADKIEKYANDFKEYIITKDLKEDIFPKTVVLNYLTDICNETQRNAKQYQSSIIKSLIKDKIVEELNNKQLKRLS